MAADLAGRFKGEARRKVQLPTGYKMTPDDKTENSFMQMLVESRLELNFAATEIALRISVPKFKQISLTPLVAIADFHSDPTPTGSWALLGWKQETTR